ncbi:MAG: transcription antitermination factor NusB [Planctomycetaceae bacterium]|nr:transcription antitermination factor NusB [Planctomycetaceae bacterium]
MSRRTIARQAAVQLLFQDEFNPQRSRDLDRQYVLDQVESDAVLADFAWWLVDGTRSQKEKLDPEIEAAAEHWSVYRMSAVDRSLIRMAAFECRSGSTPKAVAIDEAIRLAKRLGGKDSPSFVNGVLDRLLSDDASPVVHGKLDSSVAVSPESQAKDGANSPGLGLRRFIKRGPTA